MNKKVILFLCLLFLSSNLLAKNKSDNMGNHKASRNINVNSFDLDNVNTANINIINVATITSTNNSVIFSTNINMNGNNILNISTTTYIGEAAIIIADSLRDFWFGKFADGLGADNTGLIFSFTETAAQWRVNNLVFWSMDSINADVINKGNLTIGDGTNNDRTITFSADTSTGIITYMEDEAEFRFDQDVNILKEVIASTANITNAVIIGSTTYNGNDLLYVSNNGDAKMIVQDTGTIEMFGTVLIGESLNSTLQLRVLNTLGGTSSLSQVLAQNSGGVQIKMRAYSGGATGGNLWGQTRPHLTLLTTGSDADTKALVIGNQLDKPIILGVNNAENMRITSSSVTFQNNIDVKGNIAVSGTVDGIDISSNAFEVAQSTTLLRTDLNDHIAVATTTFEAIAKATSTLRTDVDLKLPLAGGEVTGELTVSSNTFISGNLHIVSTGTAGQLILQRSGTGQSNGLTLQDQVGDDMGQVRLDGITSNDLYLLSASNQDIRFFTNSNLAQTPNNERMVILSNGNVGISTDTAVFKLDVYGDVHITEEVTIDSHTVISGNLTVIGDIDLNTSFAGIKGSTDVVTTLDTGVYVPIVSNWTSDNLQNFIHSAGTLTHTGTTTHIFSARADMSLHETTGATTVLFKWHKNGIAIDLPNHSRRLPNNDVGMGAISVTVSLAPGDKLALYMTSNDGNDVLVDTIYQIVNQLD